MNTALTVDDAFALMRDIATRSLERNGGVAMLASAQMLGTFEAILIDVALGICDRENVIRRLREMA